MLALVGSPNWKANICSDSRCVTKGDCFAAIAGSKVDGHDFTAQALDNGAAYIVCQKACSCPKAEVIVVQDSSQALGLLAQASFTNPSAKLINLAVTGTNGKTTVSYLVRSVIQTAGGKCGLIGTIVYDTGAAAAEAFLTTPDAIDIAGMSREMADKGAEFMMIEASSHALSQNRLAGINFAAAAFTNLTGDHLDYHKTEEEYLKAKTVLFEQLSPDATAILNAQSPEAKEIAQKTRANILWYAVDAEADITAHIESMDVNQTVYSLGYNDQIQRVKTALIGRHNISNHLAAAGLSLAAGFELSAIAKGLSGLEFVPGRLESIDCKQSFTVLIDYAHTDDALKNVLTTLKLLCEGKLIVVFGCGGDRDRTKRPRMARVSEELADKIIVTSDNPRTESAEKIIEDIIAGFEEPDSNRITVEADRKKAIESAIKCANPNDIILIAGKGHETYQIIGNKKYDFDDRKIARDILNKIK